MEEKNTEKNTVNITICLTKEERKQLRIIALDEDMTMSALVRKWINEYLEKEKKESK